MNTVPITSTTTASVSVYTHRQDTAETALVAKIGDVIRGSLLSEKLEGIPLLLRSVTEQVVKRGGRYYIKNFWSDPTPLSLGYVGVHVRIRMPIPSKKHKYILMEVQIHAKQIMDGTGGCAKEIAHRLYKMPGETAEESLCTDLICCSQLVYLTSMTKLLYSREELRRVASTVDAIQAMTNADKKKRLVLETALLLNKTEELGSGEWNEELQAIVPRNREAVAKAWIETAAKINKMLNLPTYEMDKDYSWTNTAASIEELYTDAEQIASDFETMCAEAAGHPWCSYSFGPENKHMIKEKKSLKEKIQNKINKDKKSLTQSTPQPTETQQISQSANTPSPKNAYADLLVHLSENTAIKTNSSLVHILESQFQEVMDQDDPVLTPKQNKSYQLIQRLLVNQNVSHMVLNHLFKLHAPEECERKMSFEAYQMPAFPLQSQPVLSEQKVPPSPTPYASLSQALSPASQHSSVLSTLPQFMRPEAVCLRTFAHAERIFFLHITSDGKRALSGSWDTTLKLWNLETGQCLRIFAEHTDCIAGLQMTPDERRALSGSFDSTLKLWDLNTGQCLHTFGGHTGRIRCLQVTFDGRRALSGSNDATLKLWDLNTGKCLQTLAGHTDFVMHLQITPDGKRALSGSPDKTLKLWDLSTGQCLHTLKHAGSISCLQITPDGRRALSGSYNNPLKFWDLITGQCLQTLVVDNFSVGCLQIMPDGRRVLLGDACTLKLWDLITGQCLKTFVGHTSVIQCLQVMPDGRRVISGSCDKTLKLWDLSTGQCLQNFVGHTCNVLCLQITPDGRRVLSGSQDHTVKLWALDP